MANYTTFPCSCIVCKQPKTSKGIHSHYLISHTEEGKARNRKNRLAGGLLGTEIAKQNAHKIQAEKRIQYSENPNKCKQCDTNLRYGQHLNEFCSRSCSASFHNKHRTGVARADSVKQKISSGIRKFHIENLQPKYSKISFCRICDSVIRNKIVKTCSIECRIKLSSKTMTEWIRQNRKSNYRRDKRS